jgi:methionine synthase II (cobalamin-independent)
MLPTALLGRLPTASGFGALPALESWEAQGALETVIAAAGVPVVLHCCAPSPPLALFRRAGAWGVSVDATLLSEHDDEVLGEAVDAGERLFLGLVPSTDTTLSDVAGTVAPVRRLWRRLGFAPGLLATAVTVTPTCGLAGASPGYARAALERSVAAGRALVDDPEG